VFEIIPSVKAHLVNGWADLWGVHSVDRFKPYFSQVVEQDYFSLLPNLFRNKKLARRLAVLVCPNDIVIAHSNGCTASWLALWEGMNPRAMFWLHPALPSEIELPRTFTGRIYVIWSKADWVGHFAKIAGWIFPWVKWGAMMQTGYIGHDPRMRNEEVPGEWHLDVFLPANVIRVVQLIKEELRA
jgi:hypothetical protein